MNRNALLGCALTLIAAFVPAAEPAPPADLPAVAADLAARLAGLRVPLPDGTAAPVVGSGATALLTPERLETCLQTVSRAQAWPAAWLVVQRKELNHDLVLRLEQTDDGSAVHADFVFTTLRRDWGVDDVADVARAKTGRKPPRRGRHNVVLQGFSTRVETTWVYEVPPRSDDDDGLRSLLPEGTLIREARAVRLADGRRRTLALVLEEATFVPSDCDGCAAGLFGHADSGTVRLVLVGDGAILDQLDLTPHLRGVAGRPLLPRFRCAGGPPDEAEVRMMMSAEHPLSLLRLADHDGDGRALELNLPAAHVDCDRYRRLEARIRPDGDALEITGEFEVRR